METLSRRIREPALLEGIVTDLGPQRGVAMGLNVFTLFTGFGLGSLVFRWLLPFGLRAASAVFGGVALFAALLALPLFAAETRPNPVAYTAT